MFKGSKSYYVNVGQTLGIISAAYLGWRALRLEEAKAGIQHKTVKEVVQEDVVRARNWWNENVRYRMYQHK